MFGEDISCKFIAKWPTFYKPRVISACKDLRPGTVDDLLSAQEESNDYGKFMWIFLCLPCSSVCH